MIRRFRRRRNQFRCPECRRYLTLTTDGVWACFYSDDHENNAVLYEKT